MNIFYLSHKPSRCARWHCDKHVVKMILETAQLLYTAHWVLAAAVGRLPDLADAPLRKGTDQRGYQSIKNAKHPCAIWVRQSLDHYDWLCELGLALCDEYRHRYKGRTHSCEEHLEWLYINPPPTLASKGWSQPAQAMPDEFRRGSSIAAYRAYYVGSKGARGLLNYTKRHRPHWVAAAATSA